MSSQDALKALEIDLSVSRQLGRSPTRFFTMRTLYPLSVYYATWFSSYLRQCVYVLWCLHFFCRVEALWRGVQFYRVKLIYAGIDDVRITISRFAVWIIATLQLLKIFFSLEEKFRTRESRIEHVLPRTRRQIRST